MSPLSFKRKSVKLLLASVAMVCLLQLARFRLLWVVVVGNSMQPTFKTGDLVFVDRRAYRETDPRRGDVVVIPYRNELVIKRIVGLPGEELELKGGLLYVNGLPLQENHSGTSGDLDIGKGKLFPGKFATLGDNRNTTPLLAVHPIVTKEQIVGKVIWSIKLPRGQVRNSNPPS